MRMNEKTTGLSEQPTELAEDYLGNVSESADIARRVMQAQREDDGCLEVWVGLGDRAKGRILAKTSEGQSVGIVKARHWLLRQGDVFSTAQNRFVLVHLQPQSVMALRFEEGVSNRAIALVHLGHALGNQHWPVTAHGETLYVELVTDAAQMESTLRKIASNLGIEGLQMSFETKSPEDAMDFSVIRSDGHVH
jgi:urease accessory protein